MEMLHARGEIIAQRYRILNQLGQGGSGTTYWAEDIESHQEVALKALSLQGMTDWKGIELFQREAEVLAQLNHPAIPRYLGYFYTDTSPDSSFYIVQELAPGQSLATLVQNGWHTTEEEVRGIAIQILKIIIYLHQLKPPVIHRDIKPKNIILRSDCQVFLVDFGAVQNTYHSTFMRGSTVVGTYGYMAPEQFLGQAVPATDLYGLGATLLFLLTHRSPAELPLDRLKIDFRSHVQISEEFADWLEKMLEPDLEDRFSSGKEALAVLVGQKKIQSKSPDSIHWKGLIAVGIAGGITVSVVNYYKYPILNFCGMTPRGIYSAVERGNVKNLKKYLEEGVNPNSRDLLDETPLHKLTSIALQNPDKSKEMLDLLIAKGADVNARDRSGDTLLHEIAQYRSNNAVMIAELLIDRGADINAKNKYGRTPLHSAANLFINKDMTELLIKKGANLNAKDEEGRTPLHEVVIKKAYYGSYEAKENQELVEFLLAKGSDINAKDNEGNTPLKLAILKSGNEYLVNLLKRHGAKE